MVKANELRVGNLLQSPIGEDDPTITSDVITSRDIEGIEYGGFANSMVAIPLSEEWLINFGFIPTFDSCCFYKEFFEIKWYIECLYTLDLIKTEKRFGIRILHQFQRYYNEKGRPIAFIFLPLLIYVHQLQNLYFALTGEELTIKEK